MNAAMIIQEVAEMVGENNRLKEELDLIRRTTVNVDRFYNVTLSTEEVARLHSVSRSTVLHYVNAGLIEKHPSSGDGKVLIRASDALLLDFSEMKKQLKFRR